MKIISYTVKLKKTITRYLKWVPKKKINPKKIRLKIYK